MRIGTGYDIHRLEAGRPLILGGIEIPFERGLVGHPDDDSRFENADSAVLLRGAMDKVEAAGFRVGNLDVNVIAERPKLKPYKTAIAERVAEILGVDTGAVSIKAKTREKLGAVGRNEAIEVHCVILLLAMES